MAPSPHLALQEVLVEVEVGVPDCQSTTRRWRTSEWIDAMQPVLNRHCSE